MLNQFPKSANLGYFATLNPADIDSKTYSIILQYENPKKKQITVDPMNLKYLLASKQNWRCMSCSNPILQKDLHHYDLDYKVPKQYGGTNTFYNMGIKCSVCKTFHHNTFDHNLTKFTGNHF